MASTVVSTSAKHRMLLDYNRKRKQKYDKYMYSKTQQMEQLAQGRPDDRDELDSIDMEVKGLYKKLASDHLNKDV